jgi:site-specific recombinase XerD
MNKTDDFLHVPLSESILELIRPRFKHDFIFPEVQSDRQKRSCLKQVQKLFNPQFVRENNITLHTFRHTYAHNMLDRGVPKEVLQTLLGHRSIKTTEIYANWVKTKELEKWI